jgi:hypothetical protein
MDNKDKSYLHTREAAAFVPFLQSFLTGLLLALLAFLGMLKLRIYLVDALFWSVAVWVVVLTGVWLLLQRHWFTLTNLERLTGMDLNQDGVVAQQQPEPRESRHTVRVDIQEVTPQGHLRVVTARFSVPEWKMVQLAQGLLVGKPFSEVQWTGKNGLFSKGEFIQVRDELLRRHLLRPKNKKSVTQGFELTPSGLVVMRDLAANSPTPLREDAQSE